MSAATRVKQAAKRVMGTMWGRDSAFAAARLRRRDLVLMFHRLAPEGQQPHDIAPCVPTGLFARQIEVLTELGEIVDLAALLQPRSATQHVRFALTFDDDYASHATEAAPVLSQMGVPATCFLSGRTIMGAGAYWWEVLEHDIAAMGTSAAATALGFHALSPAHLAAQVEGTPAAAALSQRSHEVEADHLSPAGVAALARKGWTIGFHTVDHHVLPTLYEAALPDAVQRGRAELSAVVGKPLDLFAYPHGKTDPRVAAAVRAAGFRAAWTGAAVPLRPGDDPYLLGRYEPGALEVDAFAAMVAIRLNRLAPDAQ